MVWCGKALVNTPTTSQLIMLRSSRRFRERLVTSLEQRLKNAEKLTACIGDCQRKREDLAKQIAGRSLTPSVTAAFQSHKLRPRSHCCRRPSHRSCSNGWLSRKPSIHLGWCYAALPVLPCKRD